jgi:hypothetical protein
MWGAVTWMVNPSAGVGRGAAAACCCALASPGMLSRSAVAPIRVFQVMVVPPMVW